MHQSAIELWLEDLDSLFYNMKYYAPLIYTPLIDLQMIQASAHGRPGMHVQRHVAQVGLRLAPEPVTVHPLSLWA